MHYFNSIKIKNDIDFEKSYEVKKIVNKKIKKYEKTPITQYLIRWLDYESKYDEWKNLATLIDCMNLIHDYEKNEQKILIKKTMKYVQINQKKKILKKKQTKKTVSEQLVEWINWLLNIFRTRYRVNIQ